MNRDRHGNGNRRWLAGLAIAGACVGAASCGDNRSSASDEDGTLAALMADGDSGRIAPPATVPPAAPPPSRYCPSGDCSRDPLAMWRLDDCNPQSTELADTAFNYPPHPAFRAVSVGCVPAVDGQGIKLAGGDDVMYAPDQADFVFSSGLTIAAWINPDALGGSQSLVRKRMDGSSSFLLAIEGRRLHFALRLTNGRLVDLAGAIAPGRFTHVAATYDGTEAVLYLDGTPAASARARGTIAAGAGPIFIGNDASGRQFKGTVDTVWLNTLAASADTIRSLTCVRKPPLVTLTPSASAPQAAGAAADFDLAVTNNSGERCPAESYTFATQLYDPLTATPASSGVIAVGPGATAHATLTVASALQAQVGAYGFSVTVYDDAGDFVPLYATYVVGTAHVSMGIPLVPDGNGHFDGTNAAGVVGYWWSAADGYAADGTPGTGTCQTDGFTADACSVFTSPTPGALFSPDANGRLCTSGVAAQVVPDATGNFAWPYIWGNIIGFDLDNPGTLTDGLTKRAVYDAPAHGVTGFSFDIDALPRNGHLRVAFQTRGTESNAAYWGGATADLSPFGSPGHYEVRWSDIGGPLYVTNAPPFDPTTLEAIHFQVVATNFERVPFSFCISNTMLLTN